MLPVCALFFFIGVISVHAATYYVATTGNDSNPGTVSQPFRSIARGVSSLDAGDTLYVREGTWTQSFDIGTKAGTANAYITLAAYPGETVTIAPGSEPFSNSGMYRLENAFIIVDGFIFDGINAGNETYLSVGNGAHDIIIRNNEIKRWKGGGLFVSRSQNNSCSNITIKNNRIHNQISIDINRWYGIYLASCDTVLIEGNEIYNNPGGGMQLYPGPTQT